MTEGLAWLGGRVLSLGEAAVPVSDRGFLFADSVYETVRTYGGRPFLLGDHLDRLRRSAQALFMPVPWPDDELTAAIDELLEAWGRDSALRIMVTRGEGGSGLDLPSPQRPRLVLLCRPLQPYPQEVYVEGVRLGLPALATAKDGSVPAWVKSGSYLANVLALREVRQRGGFEALLRGADGTWAEGATSNLFVVRDGVVHTPGVRDSILPGITRRLVLTLARRGGLAVRESPLSDEELFAADEVFLTASIKEVVPVVRIDDAVVGTGRPGPVTRRLMAEFADAVTALQSAGVTRLADGP